MARVGIAAAPSCRTDDSLDELVARARQRDRAAVTALLTAVAPRVLAAVRGVLGSEATDIDDVVQESLLALVSALPSFRGDCPLASFACGVAVRTALRSRRRWLRRAPKHAQFERECGDDRVDADVDAEVDRARRLAMLRSLLTTLPPEQGEALALRCMLDADLPDIAAVFGVPINTVRSRIRLARTALLARIESDPDLRALFEVDHG